MINTIMFFLKYVLWFMSIFCTLGFIDKLFSKEQITYSFLIIHTISITSLLLAYKII